MAKKVERLSAVAVAKANEPGMYPDGAGLYLRVGRGGAKSWAFRFMLNRKAREMGLGGLTKAALRTPAGRPQRRAGSSPMVWTR
jgi:hypothetical protein